MNKLNILFAGAGEFAIPIVKALLSSEAVNIVGIITQPDKPVGREQQLEGAPLKKYLDETGFSGQVFQPEKLRLDSQNILEQTLPDLLVVAAYGQMVPEDMLTQPKLGAINLHGSLLPQLRGAVPVPMAILQGLGVTGVTIQKMVKALDAGDIYAQREEPIHDTDTTESLKARLADVGAAMLLELLPRLADGSAELIPQNQDDATFCYEADIAKDKAEIAYSTPAILAERMVRAFYPWPIAWLSYPVNGEIKRLKIFGAQLFTELPQLTPVRAEFEIVRYGKRLLLILESGVLELLDVQLESKVRHSAADYLFLASRSVAAAD